VPDLGDGFPSADCHNSDIPCNLLPHQHPIHRHLPPLNPIQPRRKPLLCPLQQEVQHRHDHKRQEGGDEQAEADHHGHGLPELTGLAHPGHAHLGEVVGRAGDHRHKAEDGGDRGQEHRPQAGRSGEDHRLLQREAPCPQDVGVVNQDNGVVHRHAGQRDHPDAGHDDAEGHLVEHQAGERPACGQND
jgi:hypothetical protein